MHTYIKAKLLELLLMYTVHVSMYYGNLMSINSIINLIKCSGTLTHMKLKKVIKLNRNYGLLMRVFCVGLNFVPLIVSWPYIVCIISWSCVQISFADLD